MTRRRAGPRTAVGALRAFFWVIVLSSAGLTVIAADPNSLIQTDYRMAAWPPRAASPQFELVDFDGKTRSLKDYAGRTVVLFFGFLHCPEVCPAELLKLSQVMKKLGPLATHVQVLFVTLDPERDTREQLKKYVTYFDPRFVGLTGSNAEIDRVAANFHVEYARVGTGSDYTIDHSTSTFVIDGSGRLRVVGTVTTPVADYVHDLAVIVAP